MDYIKMEEFKKLNDNVKKVFINWWKPSIGDLVIGKLDEISVVRNERDIFVLNKYKGEPYNIPLFTEGQLRKFIEENANIDIEIVKNSSCGKCNGIMFYDRNKNRPIYYKCCKRFYIKKIITYIY